MMGVDSVKNVGLEGKIMVHFGQSSCVMAVSRHLVVQCYVVSRELECVHMVPSKDMEF